MATQIADTPYSLAAGEGEQLSWFDATMTLKASAPGLGVIETVIGPGDEPPLHVHESEDEWFYLLEGELVPPIQTDRVWLAHDVRGLYNGGT